MDTPSSVQSRLAPLQPENLKPYIWLHIKKAGGQSMRRALGDHYVRTARYSRKKFDELPQEQWNDCLNNYRVDLGKYDGRRMLYAKKFLYSTEAFSDSFKFAIVRNPYARAVSSWTYLNQESSSLRPRSLLRRYSFEYFLKSLPDVWAAGKERRLAAHTAPIWPDVTDDNGELLLDYVPKLETIEADLPIIAEAIGLSSLQFPHVNNFAIKRRLPWREYYSTKTRSLVEQLYACDIEKLGYDF